MTKSERLKKVRREQKQRAIGMLGGKCEDCSSTSKLEFHHENPASKAFNIGQYLGRIRWARIEEEVVKCSLKCRTCHEEFHGLC